MAGKIPRLITLLRKEYPDTRTALRSSNPFQLLIATILSAQTTDVRVNQVTPELFRRFPGPRELARAPLEQIMDAVRSVNFYRNKSRNIKKLSQLLVERMNGRLPDSMEGLTQLPGVARKTANVVLSQAFGKAEGIVVDTHVLRVSQRLGLTRQDDPVKVEQDLMKALPRKEWIGFPFRLILHGRQVCKARNPECPRCVLRGDCDYYRRIAASRGA
jgi:endonuclease III